MKQLYRSHEIEAFGAGLSARLYRPDGPSRAAMVLHGATGVPQRYYEAFAAWAAGQGITVLTYDYRDFGASLHGHPRDSKASFADWLIHDQAAAQQALARLVPTGPLWILGHSLGGLGVPFHAYDPRVTRILTLGSGLGHYTDHPWRYRPTVLAFWFLLGPVATKIAGYMPGKRLLLGADLPAGVYWQWRRWCTSRDFYAADIGGALPLPDYARTRADIRICCMTDDAVAPAASVQRYAKALAPSGARYLELAPSAYGLQRLGHIEVLGRGNEALWSELLDTKAAPATDATTADRACA